MTLVDVKENFFSGGIAVSGWDEICLTDVNEMSIRSRLGNKGRRARSELSESAVCRNFRVFNVGRLKFSPT